MKRVWIQGTGTRQHGITPMDPQLRSHKTSPSQEEAVGTLVIRLLNEVDALFTHEALNSETPRVHRGRLERLQHRLTKVDSAIGILILEKNAKKEFGQYLDYHIQLTTRASVFCSHCTARHASTMCVPLYASSRSGEAQEKGDTAVKPVALQLATAKGNSRIVLLWTTNVSAAGENERVPTSIFFDEGSQTVSYHRITVHRIWAAASRETRDWQYCFRRS